MTEQIRQQQIAQGFEPCFGTDRVDDREWIEKSCVKCCYYQACEPIGKLVAHQIQNNTDVRDATILVKHLMAKYGKMSKC